MAVQQFGIGGIFEVECYSSSGKLKWKAIAKNAVVNSAKNNILNTYFGGALSSGSDTVKARWAVGLISGPASGNVLSLSDTHDNHGGWTEFTAYSESVRANWGAPGAAAVTAATSQQLTNSLTMTFTISSPGTVAGLFIVGGTLGGGATNADTKGSTNATPLLFSTANFTTGDQIVAATDTIRATYTLAVS